MRQGKKAVVKKNIELQQDKTYGVNDAGSQGVMVEHGSSIAASKDRIGHSANLFAARCAGRGRRCRWLAAEQGARSTDFYQDGESHGRGMRRYVLLSQICCHC